MMKPSLNRRRGVHTLAIALTIAAIAATPALAQHSPSAVYQLPLDRIETFVVGNDGH